MCWRGCSDLLDRCCWFCWFGFVGPVGLAFFVLRGRLACMRWFHWPDGLDWLGLIGVGLIGSVGGV